MLQPPLRLGEQFLVREGDPGWDRSFKGASLDLRDPHAKRGSALL